MTTILLLKAKIANMPGYHFLNGRWHRLSPELHGAGSQHAGKHLTDDEWQQLYLPEDNANARTHNPALKKLRAMSEAGDIDGILGQGIGTNTYGKRYAKIANHLLERHGVAHRVTPGQKSGQHPAVSGKKMVVVQKELFDNYSNKINNELVVTKQPEAKVDKYPDIKIGSRIYGSATDYIQYDGNGVVSGWKNGEKVGEKQESELPAGTFDKWNENVDKTSPEAKAKAAEKAEREYSLFSSGLRDYRVWQRHPNDKSKIILGQDGKRMASRLGIKVENSSYGAAVIQMQPEEYLSLADAEAEKIYQQHKKNEEKAAAENAKFEKMKSGYTYLKVPFAEKDEAKKHGAKWDGAKKSWYFDGKELPDGLKKWAA